MIDVMSGPPTLSPTIYIDRLTGNLYRCLHLMVFFQTLQLLNRLYNLFNASNNPFYCINITKIIVIALIIWLKVTADRALNKLGNKI